MFAYVKSISKHIQANREIKRRQRRRRKYGESLRLHRKQHKNINFIKHCHKRISYTNFKYIFYIRIIQEWIYKLLHRNDDITDINSTFVLLFCVATVAVIKKKLVWCKDYILDPCVRFSRQGCKHG